MRFSILFTLALLGLTWFIGDAQAWPRRQANTAYTSSYLAPYYPPGPIYSTYYPPYPTVAYYPAYYYPATAPSGYYPSAYNRYDVPLTTTGIPRYWNGLTPPSSNDYSSDKWRR